jgi:hypothetical protein
MPPVYFYIPREDWPIQELPKSLKRTAISANLQSLGTPSLVVTAYSWILQTYLWLKADDFPCTLVGTLPSEGIVIAYWGSIPLDCKPSPRLLLVSVLADGLYPHPYSQLRIVQNRQQAALFHNSYYMPHWPQPGLIPRRPTRSDRFENIGFFGAISNLSPELKSASWQSELKALGLNWHVVEPGRWHDYSNIDAVVAVRDFQQRDFFQKPATKLFNAWHAGVPAILGCESAFQAERQSDLDYIEVSSPDEILVALKQLRDTPELRRAMIANGQLRAEETSIENLTAQWRDFITEVAVPAYEDWCSASYIKQQSLFMQRFLSKKMNGLSSRMQKVFATSK